MFGILFKYAFREFCRLRRVVPWLAITVFLCLITFVWKRIDPRTTPDQIFSQIQLMLSYRVLALSAAVFSTAVIAQEVEQRTIVYLLTRPIPRHWIVLARSLASALTVWILSAITATAVGIVAFGPSFLIKPAYVGDLLVFGVGALAYGALFVMFSLWFNRALIVCLMFAFGWETAVPNMPGDPSYMSIFSYLTSISAHPVRKGARGFMDILAGQVGGTEIGIATAWVVLLSLIGGLSLLAAWWFTRFEYVPREDAE